MVASIRYKDIPNTTGALLPSGSPALLCNTGQDYALEYITHIFDASEIGTGSGQTRDTTSNPTTGFLVAQFQGSSIKNIIHAVVKKTVTGANGGTVFRSFAWATVTPHIYNISFRIVNSTPADAALPGYNPNYSSIYMLDTGSNAATQAAAADALFLLVSLGNS